MSGCSSCGSNKKISIPRTIFQGIKAAPRVARQVVFSKYVTPDVKAERLNKCFKCPNYQPKDQRCIECTCFLDKKTIFTDEKCSIGKW